MIGLGLRLTLSGGREAVTRLVVIAVAMAIGAGMLLTTLAGINAVNTQNSRYAWLETGFVPAAADAPTGDPVWWSIRADYFDGKQIGRVDVAPTGPNPPLPPGVSALPGPGEYYASPALASLLGSTPASQLGDRFGGTQAGTIGPAALPAPDSLLIIVGHRVDELSKTEARLVTSISTTTPDNCDGQCALGVGIDANGIVLILSVVVAALLFPVLVFVGAATRLSATRREQRFAAMRLVGATPRQITVISTVESGVAAVVGVAVGFGLFYLLRPVLAPIPFTGSRFYTSDLSLGLRDAVLVAVGVPVAATIMARLALRRVRISPLGVSRRVTPRPPRAWRVIPLVAGLAEMGYFAAAGSPDTVAGQQAAYLSGLLLIMAGLIIAGPWLTMAGSRLMVWRARRPATLIAARRLADNPKAGFRAISGLVLALYVGTGALGVITTMVTYKVASAGDHVESSTLIDRFNNIDDPSQAPAVSATTMDRLTSIPGVSAVALTHWASDKGPDGRWLQRELIACADLAGVPALGRCADGAVTAEFFSATRAAVIDHEVMSERVWPGAAVSTDALRAMPAAAVIVGTDGSRAAVEQARTVLSDSFPAFATPLTIGEDIAEQNRLVDQYVQLAMVVIFTSLPIAGCSLAVGVAGGLSERRRPFSLLRLTGAPVTMLRRVITLETTVPLLLTAAVSAGSGLLTAHLFLRAQLDEALQPPGVEYYLSVAVGLVASLAVLASTLPMVRRITGPESARNE